MSEPCFAITGDDARFYTNPNTPDVHNKSVTTVKKQGVPNPVMDKWLVKEVATCAINNDHIVTRLKRKAVGYQMKKMLTDANK